MAFPGGLGEAAAVTDSQENRMRRDESPSGAVHRITVTSKALQANLMGDPAERRVDV